MCIWRGYYIYAGCYVLGGHLSVLSVLAVDLCSAGDATLIQNIYHNEELNKP